MSTPYDPGRPEDRPADQPGYPSAPPPQQYPQGSGDAPQGGGYQQAPDYGSQQPPYAGGPGGGYGNAPGNAPGYGNAPGAPGYGNAPGNAPGYANAPSYGNAPEYGNAPAYGNPGFGTPPGRPDVTAPADVIRATQLMFVRVAIGVISALITFASGNAVKDSIRNSNPSLTPSEVDSAYRVGVGVAIVFGLIFAVLYILLAIQVRKGKNWARIVTWVLAGLGVLSGLLGLFGTGTGLEKVIAVILLLIDAAIIVLLARKPANEYFSAMKAPRY